MDGSQNLSSVNSTAESTALKVSTKISNLCALVADDDPALRELMTDVLGHFGLKCDAVPDGQFAIDKLSSKSYDIILLDWNMPNMDGLSAARIIRADSKYDHIPIIAVTANSSETDRLTCLNAGMNDFVAKPYSLDSVKKVLLRWLIPNTKDKYGKFKYPANFSEYGE